MANNYALERRKARVLEHIYAGLSDAKVAEALSGARLVVSAQAVTQFRERHADEIVAHNAQLEREVSEYAIAHKVNRIAALDERWNRMQDLIEARATDGRYDEPGYETGLMVHQLKAIGSGKGLQVVDQYVTDAGLLAEMRATERAAAEELSQIEKAGAAGAQAIASVVNIIRGGSGLGMEPRDH